MLTASIAIANPFTASQAFEIFQIEVIAQLALAVLLGGAIGIAIGAGDYIVATGAGILVTVVLAGLGRVEYSLRRVRRVVNMTIKTKPETTLESIRATLQEEGIRVKAATQFDHPRDRTFELRLTGPAVQFDV